MARNAPAYDEDYYAWTIEQAQLLRTGELSSIDAANLAEEIDGIGISNRRELERRLTVLITHLLKWRYQPGFRSRSWAATISEQRRKTDGLLRESPSLRPPLATVLPEEYGTARDHALAETGLPDQVIPEGCPFTLEQILAKDFLPEETARRAVGAGRRAKP